MLASNGCYKEICHDIVVDRVGCGGVASTVLGGKRIVGVPGDDGSNIIIGLDIILDQSRVSV